MSPQKQMNWPSCSTTIKRWWWWFVNNIFGRLLEWADAMDRNRVLSKSTKQLKCMGHWLMWTSVFSLLQCNCSQLWWSNAIILIITNGNLQCAENAAVKHPNKSNRFEMSHSRTTPVAELDGNYILKYVECIHFWLLSFMRFSHLALNSSFQFSKQTKTFPRKNWTLLLILNLLCFQIRTFFYAHCEFTQQHRDGKFKL